MGDVYDNKHDLRNVKTSKYSKTSSEENEARYDEIELSVSDCDDELAFLQKHDDRVKKRRVKSDSRQQNDKMMVLNNIRQKVVSHLSPNISHSYATANRNTCGDHKAENDKKRIKRNFNKLGEIVRQTSTPSSHRKVESRQSSPEDGEITSDSSSQVSDSNESRSNTKRNRKSATFKEIRVVRKAPSAKMRTQQRRYERVVESDRRKVTRRLSPTRQISCLSDVSSVDLSDSGSELNDDEARDPVGKVKKMIVNKNASSRRRPRDKQVKSHIRETHVEENAKDGKVARRKNMKSKQKQRERSRDLHKNVRKNKVVTKDFLDTLTSSGSDEDLDDRAERSISRSRKKEHGDAELPPRRGRRSQMNNCNRPRVTSPQRRVKSVSASSDSGSSDDDQSFSSIDSSDSPDRTDARESMSSRLGTKKKDVPREPKKLQDEMVSRNKNDSMSVKKRVERSSHQPSEDSDAELSRSKSGSIDFLDTLTSESEWEADGDRKGLTSMIVSSGKRKSVSRRTLTERSDDDYNSRRRSDHRSRDWSASKRRKSTYRDEPRRSPHSRLGRIDSSRRASYSRAAFDDCCTPMSDEERYDRHRPTARRSFGGELHSRKESIGRRRHSEVYTPRSRDYDYNERSRTQKAALSKSFTVSGLGSDLFSRELKYKIHELWDEVSVDDARHVLRDQVSSNVPFVDTHCHIDFLFKRLSFFRSFDDYMDESFIKFPKNFEGCIADWCQPSLYDKATSAMESMNCKVWGAIGCHPHFVSSYDHNVERVIVDRLTNDPRMIAIGEMGLDYSDRFGATDHNLQIDIFKKQLKLAERLDVPIVIHCRDADPDLFRIMKTYVRHDTMIHRHCLTTQEKDVRPLLDYFPNCYVGFTNLLSNKSAYRPREAAKRIPLNRILLETDSPYFIPRCVSEVSKGAAKFSHSGMASSVAHELALLKDSTVDDVLKQIRKNVERLYGV